MNTSTLRARMGGWSLLELAVVLVIMGLVGLVVWRIVPLGHQVAAGDPAALSLEQAEQGLEGFVLANNRLPYADATGSGIETPGSTKGFLPVRSLGLPSSTRIRYTVDAALAAAVSIRLRLLMPPDVPADAPNNGAAYQHVANGLDFCLALKDASVGGTLKLDGDVSAAYALSYTGRPGNDNDPPPADDIPMPGTAAAIGRQVLAAGPGEFATRLACADRVSRVLAAARAAYAADDLVQFATRFAAFRDFGLTVANTNLDFATLNMVMASFGLALGTAIEALSAALDFLGWPPASGIAFAVIGHAAAGVGLGWAAFGVADAKTGLDDAKADVEDAKAQQQSANAYLARTKTLYAEAYLRVRTLDAAGLAP
jgi:hypothetical protein